MAYIKEYWNDKEKRAEQAIKHTKEMDEKYYRCIETSILNTKIYDEIILKILSLKNTWIKLIQKLLWKTLIVLVQL